MSGVRVGLWLVLVAVMAAALWLLRPPDAGAPGAPISRSTVVEQDPVSVAPSLTAADDKGDSTAPTDTPKPHRQGLPDATGAHLFGRCVDQDGVPVAGATVHVQGVRGTRVLTTSTTDGTFSLRCEPVARTAVQLRAASSQHLEIVLECGALTAGETRDVGDLTLVSGCLVVGRVLDATGRPVPSLAVHAMPVGEAWRTAPRVASGVTGADGAFTLNHVLAAGRWLLRADPREFLAPALFTLDVGSLRHDLQLTLADQRIPATITGKVVDAAGLPASGIDIAVRNSEFVSVVTSDWQGDFRLVGWDHVGDAHIVLVPTDGEPDDAPQSVLWGSKDVRLVWRRGTDLEVLVRRQETGEPVTGAEVSVMFMTSQTRPIESAWSPGGPSRPTSTRTNAEGLAIVSQLPPTTGLVVVRARGLVALAHPRVRTGNARKLRVEVALASTIERTLTVRSSDGKTLPRARVVLWEAAELAAVSSTPPTSQWSFTSYDSRYGTQLGDGFTDQHGRCALRAPAHQAGTLRISAPNYGTLTREHVVLAAMPEPWIEVVGAGGVIEGRLDSGMLPRLGMLRVARLDRAHEVFPEQPTAPQFASDGTFRLRGVPPGSWRLQHMVMNRVQHLADVLDLRENETRRVEIDSSKLVVAELSGTIRWNGRPFVGGFQFMRIDTDAGSPPGSLRHSASARDEGVFQTQLEPGRYRATIPHRTGGIGSLPLPEEIVLAPGTRTECDLHLRTRAVRLRVLRRGRPAPGVVLRAVVDERFDLTFYRTDDYGCAEFALPLGVHPLFVVPRKSEGARVPLGSIDVIAGEGPQIVVLNVPDEVGR